MSAGVGEVTGAIPLPRPDLRGLGSGAHNSMEGTFSCMENGKMAAALNLHNRIACGSTEFHVLRPCSTILAGK